jgi:transposase
MTLPPLPEVPASDWAKTPPSVVALVMAMASRIAALEARVAELEDQLRTNSTNSSKPPSSDGPGVVRPPRPRGRRRKRGGQAGHRRATRALLPVDQVDAVHEVRPPRCDRCACRLRGTDVAPRRHQVTELPPLARVVTEYRLHAVRCMGCGHMTRAALPPDVPRGAFGPRLQATIAVLAGAWRLGHRPIRDVLRTLFGVEVALGAVTDAQQVAAAALARPVTAAEAAARAAPVAHVDETGWREAKRRAWLWVLATAAVTVFRIQRRRDTAAAQALLGTFAGHLVSDRWAAYGWVDRTRRQLCWAHLRRDWQKMIDRGGPSARIGRNLWRWTRQLFTAWHRVRAGTRGRRWLRRALAPVQRAVVRWLRRGTTLAHGRTAGTCREILALEPALWTFARVPGIEPTNNFGERQIRHGVLWRRTSFGTDSPRGSRFVERVLTTVMTLRQQGRNVLEFVRDAIVAARDGLVAPSLLPPTSMSAIT